MPGVTAKGPKGVRAKGFPYSTRPRCQDKGPSALLGVTGTVRL